jgi:hypothetical protein
MTTVMHTNSPDLATQAYSAEEDSAYVSTLLRGLTEMRSTHPEVMRQMDDADLNTAPRAHLVHLMRIAPTDALRHFILGKFMLRLAISQVSQRPFD